MSLVINPLSCTTPPSARKRHNKKRGKLETSDWVSSLKKNVCKTKMCLVMHRFRAARKSTSRSTVIYTWEGGNRVLFVFSAFLSSRLWDLRTQRHLREEKLAVGSQGFRVWREGKRGPDLSICLNDPHATFARGYHQFIPWPRPLSPSLREPAGPRALALLHLKVIGLSVS